MTSLSIADKEFLEKVENTVKENIPNESFGVSELADILGMSRSNLHRKVNAITKISVSRYIRHARLEHGKELLQTTSLTVSEVAYKAGFNSPSYFIKCFHDHFGYPPGEVSEMVVDDSGEVKEADKSIAVLPFKSLSTDPEKQYLADGVMDAILLHLSKVEDLRVISRTSVEQYRDTEKTVSNICQELDVSYLLEGSFQKYGDEARLIVQMIQPGKEGHMWANDYDRNWRDIFAVQSEVAQTVAGELKAVITPEEKQLIEKVPTQNLTAYETYLEGKFYLNNSTPEGLDKALQYFQRAKEIDSEFAL
ncbi:MAG: helix-turn-helix domain-containing protein, partial [Draconibacterium sp.]|nr:helix-turn-helix domain-containing protein [Draconibacterium sp.]